ncbi:MAG: carotenoid oxygenase family protein [Rubrobacteraceae bacterium]
MTDYRIGFQNLNDEIEVDNLPVEGNIPQWLSGTLVRNGPGRWDLEDGKDMRHWFDGLAMPHRFSFVNGKVSYANRFLESPQYRSIRETGQIAYGEFATTPDTSFFERLRGLFSSPEFGSNASVNVYKAFEDRFVALTETPPPVEFDPETLDTLGVLGFEGDLQVVGSSPHPHTDPQTGDFLNHATSFSARSSYKIFRVRPGSRRREVISEIPAWRPSYMHSFGQTLRHIILAEYPLTVNPLDMLLYGKSYAETLKWQPENPTRFHVIEKDTGRVLFVRETEPFFCFHQVNAFERGGEIFFDLLAYPDDQIIHNLYLDVLRDPSIDISGAIAGELRRYRLDPLSGGTADYEVLSDERTEFPRIDYKRAAGRPYTFAYGAGLSDGGDWIDRIVKMNVENGTSSVWQEDNRYPSEPIFVPSPDAEREDEGVVLSVVLDAAEQSSFLLVLDARSFEEVARARVPHLMPFGFHGEYFD